MPHLLRLLTPLLLLAFFGCQESTLRATSDPDEEAADADTSDLDASADPRDAPSLDDAAPDAAPGEDVATGADATPEEDATRGDDAADEQDTGPPTFTGTRSGVFFKQDCASSCAGTAVRYTSEQTSLISVEDAERLAAQELLAAGQEYADVNGGCDCAPAACGCENFANHGAGSPHLYSSAWSGSLIGEVIAECAPLYWIEGLMDQPAPMVQAGTLAGSTKKLFRYKHPADTTPRNTHVRSVGEGCEDFPDIRTQFVNPDTFATWGGLPELPAIDNPSTAWLPLFVSGDLEFQSYESANIWSIITPQVLPSLRFRVNNGEWASFYEVAWPWFFYLPPATFMETGYLSPPKDFILDVTTDEGASIQRFTVFRSSQGGHYSMITVLTRQDGQVFATVQLASAEVRQRLMDPQTGRVYPSLEAYNHLFDLGLLPEGEHVFSLWSTDDALLDDHVQINVRRTP